MDNQASEKGVIPTSISNQMEKAYLDYAMSVIVSRALPDVRDGLKPVQRRIIYAMHKRNYTFENKFNKCAAVVGNVMENYHPHGDTSIYDALVRMGQDFSMRYQLIVPQGNFGSIDPDPPAAMRYTECKLQKLSELLYADIDKETVPFEINDLQNYEPAFLPSSLPNLLINGATGIAVGMATNIPPHNLSEVIDGLHLMVEKGDLEKEDFVVQEIEVYDAIQKINTVVPTFSSSATVEDLIEHIQGPDFPTGATIYDKKEIMHMYATGRGRVVMRAKMETEESKTGRTSIVITEIPYQVHKSTLLSKIADLVKEKKISGISDLRDESSSEGLRLVVELKKDAIVKQVQNRLYKFTPLQSNFSTNMVALINDQPKLMTLKMILEEFIKHRQLVIIKRSLYDLRKAKEREHILQGLKIAIDNIDEVIETIKKSKDAETAKTNLMVKFELSQYQAQAILDMQLRRLAALEIQKIEEELNGILSNIQGLEDLVASSKKIMETIISELNEIKDKFGDARKTKVIKGGVGELSEEDLIKDEKCLITFSNSGYIRRLTEDTYKKQGRGGKGVIGSGLKDEDEIDRVKGCNTHDWAFFFTNTGKVYKLRIWEIPEASRKAKGTALVNFLSIKQDERVEAFLTLSTQELEGDKGFVFLATQKGVVKKTELNQFENIRTSGIKAINLADDDNLLYAGLTSGEDDILLATTLGQSIRFKEKDVRSMGRAAGGVGGIKFAKEEDYVVGAVIITPDNKNLYLMIATEKGYGKKTQVNEYKTQKRAGSGIKTYNITAKTGKVVTAKILDNKKDTDLLMATTSGQIIRLGAKQVPKLGRATLGVKLISLRGNDHVASVADISDESEVEVQSIVK